VTLRRLCYGQARSCLLAGAAAVQMRKEQKRHDEGGNEPVCMHALAALHDTLLHQNIAPAVGEFRERCRGACSDDRRRSSVSTVYVEALQDIADNEQQTPELEAEQYEPRSKRSDVLQRGILH